MVRIVKQDVVKYDPIEENYYVGTLTGIKELPGKFGPSLRFSFKIEGFDNVVASILLGFNLRPGTKLDLALRACGYNTDVGDALETDEIVAMGLKARVFVESNANAEGQVFYNVRKIKSISAPNTVTAPVTYVAPRAAAPTAAVPIAPRVATPAPVQPRVATPAPVVQAPPQAPTPAPVPQPPADVEAIDFNN